MLFEFLFYYLAAKVVWYSLWECEAKKLKSTLGFLKLTWRKLNESQIFFINSTGDWGCTTEDKLSCVKNPLKEGKKLRENK